MFVLYIYINAQFLSSKCNYRVVYLRCTLNLRKFHDFKLLIFINNLSLPTLPESANHEIIFWELLPQTPSVLSLIPGTHVRVTRKNRLHTVVL